MTNIFIIKQLNKHFGDREYFTRQELYNFFKIYESDLKISTFGWRIYNLKGKGIITSIRKGIYTLNKKRDYKPILGENVKRIAKAIVKDFPSINYCILDTEWYNEFTIHQFSRTMVIIETEKDITNSLYYRFKDKDLYNVFLNPNDKMTNQYVNESNNPIIIKSIISRSPIMKVYDYNIPRIEKMLVDLYCDSIYNIFSKSEKVNIFKTAYKYYKINFSTFINYAKRRKRYEKIKILLNSNFDNNFKDLLL